MYNYKKACDQGKGAILLCVVRGHISEGVHFNDHYGRCCVLMGVPFLWVKWTNVTRRNSQSKELKIKLEYLRNEYDIDENEYYVYDADSASSDHACFLTDRVRSAWDEPFEIKTTTPSWCSPISGTIARTTAASCPCGSNRWRMQLWITASNSSPRITTCRWKWRSQRDGCFSRRWRRTLPKPRRGC